MLSVFVIDYATNAAMSVQLSWSCRSTNDMARAYHLHPSYVGGRSHTLPNTQIAVHWQTLRFAKTA